MVFRQTVASFLLTVTVATAHDIWLLPDAFVLARGDTLVVRQMLGEELARGEEELALMRRMTPRFELITPEGSFDLLVELPPMRERPEVKPILERRVDFDGLALVAMEHAFIHHEMTETAFLDYLRHEELDPVEYRPHMGRSELERERYARFFKSLIRVGDTRDGQLHQRIVGHELEIALDNNPYELRAGDSLAVRILLRGEPLTGARVAAHRARDDEVVRTSARTDDQGLARFTVDGTGTWLLRLVYLTPCPELDEGCADVEWQSYWASFSFAVPETP